MKKLRLTTYPRLAAMTGVLALIGAAAALQSPVSAATGSAQPFTHHVVIAAGLDNPRQLQLLRSGDFLVAEAGHGATNPANCSSGKHPTCIGITGKVTRIHHGHANLVMSGLLSIAGSDGSFAVGSDGASYLPTRPYLAIETYGPAKDVPPGLPKGQLGHLMAKDPNGKLHAVANITAYERAHDPDGEGFDSDPYSVLQLDRQTLVADAAGDDILKVVGSHVSLWTLMPEYGPKYDAVPTVVSLGADGNIYVGELHSELPGLAHVWEYTRSGQLIRGWRGFTTVTGVARGLDGTLYVSELEGGSCGQQVTRVCIPGDVVKVAPDGTRTSVAVPFPHGIAVRAGNVYVNAWSIAPGTGFQGNPAWTGQLWQIYP